MSTDASFAAFAKELNRLVAVFERILPELKKPGYAEAQLRDDFLNPLFRAPGCTSWFDTKRAMRLSSPPI